MSKRGVIIGWEETEGGDYLRPGTEIEVLGETRGRYGPQPWLIIRGEDFDSDLIPAAAVRFQE